MNVTRKARRRRSPNVEQTITILEYTATYLFVLTREREGYNTETSGFIEPDLRAVTLLEQLEQTRFSQQGRWIACVSGPTCIALLETGLMRQVRTVEIGKSGPIDLLHLEPDSRAKGTCYELDLDAAAARRATRKK
jgi:hypothetical protein